MIARRALATSGVLLLACCGGQLATTTQPEADAGATGVPGATDAGATGVPGAADASGGGIGAVDASGPPPTHPGPWTVWAASYTGVDPRLARAADGSVFFTLNEYVPVSFDGIMFGEGPALVKLGTSHKALWAVQPYTDTARAWTVAVDSAGDPYLSYLGGGARKFSGADGHLLWSTDIQNTMCMDISTANGRVAISCLVMGGAPSYTGADGGVVTLPTVSETDLLVAVLDAQTGAVLWANGMGTGAPLQPAGSPWAPPATSSWREPRPAEASSSIRSARRCFRWP